MSRFISTLLSKEKTFVGSLIENLEDASGEAEVDARLTSELIIQTKTKLKELGLDDNDTTSEELYSALNSLVTLHDKFLSKKLGINDNDVNQALLKITKFTDKEAKKRNSWTIKHSVVKRLIKKTPPKLLMKKLNYRSIDSMIKRENPIDLIAGAKLIESSDWQKKFYDNFKFLKASDFEAGKLSVHYLSSSKWQKATVENVAKSKNNIISVKELGSVVVMPLPVAQLEGVVIAVLPLILYLLNEIHLYGAYFKFQQMRPNFGKMIGQFLLNGQFKQSKIAGMELSWRNVYQLFSNIKSEESDISVDPFLQIDDLSDISICECLYKLEPALHFWYGNESLGIAYEDYSISFNLLDVATNFVNKLQIPNNSTKYLKDSLWDEMLKRYISTESINSQVMDQINPELSNEEFSNVGNRVSVA